MTYKLIIILLTLTQSLQSQVDLEGISRIKLENLFIENLGDDNLGLHGDIVPYYSSSFGYDLGNNNANEHWDNVVANDFVTFSDRRLKTNIQDMPNVLPQLMKLKPVQYSYNKSFAADGRLRMGY